MNTVEKWKDHGSDMEVGAAESRIILYDFFVLIVIDYNVSFTHDSTPTFHYNGYSNRWANCQNRDALFKLKRLTWPNFTQW